MTPSMDWKEVVPEGEAAGFEAIAAQMGQLQARLGEKPGTIRRGLHAKPNLVARAKFEVLGELPPHARAGFFAEPKTFDAVVRFSNGGPAARRDAAPDVRGIGVKLIGVPGQKLIPGMESALTQDFLAILTESQPFRTPADFVFFVLNARSPLRLVSKALLRMGPFRLFPLLARLQRGLNRPIGALHTNRYFSALPISWGRYAVKFSFTPQNGAPELAPPNPDLGGALATVLAARDLSWDFQVQFFTDEATTPIEDATVDWQGPWLTVGRLTIPQQAVGSEAGQRLAAWAETLSFDPWHAHADLRPLGAMMRSRSPAYRVSTQARNAAPEPTALPEEFRQASK